MINVLLIHQNLPSQFNNLIPYLRSRPDVKLIGIKERNPTSPFSDHRILKGMEVAEYTLNPLKENTDQPILSLLDERIMRGKIVGQIAELLKKRNFYPDIIVGHTGWGETMFLKDRFPKAKLVLLQEYFYSSHAPDINFDPEFQVNDAIIEIANVNRLPDLHSCMDADIIITPTQWQAKLIPTEFQHKVEVVHDGIRTDIFHPDDNVHFDLPNGKRLTKENKVITYIARGLEPYRGFHIFMRAIPEIQKRDPDIEIVIVGNNGVYYSPKLPDDEGNFKEYYLRELGDKIDLSKVHFFANLAQPLCINLMQISTLHVYFTYPFYSSLSIFEVLSCGCTVLGSATPPVQEFIKDKDTGYLFNFFDIKGFAEKAVHIVNQDPIERHAVGQRARDMIKSRLDWSMCIEPFWENLLKLQKI